MNRTLLKSFEHVSTTGYSHLSHTEALIIPTNGVLQSLRIEGSHLSEFPEFLGAPICTNLKMEEAPICPNYIKNKFPADF